MSAVSYTIGGAPAPEQTDEPITIRQSAMGPAIPITDVDHFNDSDIVRVSGMSMRYAEARNAGLLDISDTMGDNPAAVEDAGGDDAAGEDNSQWAAETFEHSVEVLHEALEDGSMSPTEVQAFEAIIGSVALEGETIGDVANAIEAIKAGDFDPAELPEETRNMLKRVESEVTTITTRSVIEEIGQEGFNELEAYSNYHPDAAAAIREVAMARAQGLGEGVTWTDMLTYARENWR